ncbi:MAG: methylmalonyl-CoA mutase family protein, partial [Gemmatimonadales bacterium]
MTSIDSRRAKPIDELEAAREENERLRAEIAEWQRKFDAAPKREIAFTNSAYEVAPLYTALDVSAEDSVDLGAPGVYPYTRGIHP